MSGTVRISFSSRTLATKPVAPVSRMRLPAKVSRTSGSPAAASLMVVVMWVSVA